ncbi:MAG: hypothetical protein PHF65_06100 [Oscillospiraceae bacterium]|nr:hypothetical protein [Oscillospiraceae bacterium]
MQMSPVMKKDIELIKVFAGITLAVIFCILGVFFLEYQLQKSRSDLISAFARENEYIVRTVADRMRAEAESTEDVIGIVREAPATGTRYWMLFTESGPLFERDADTSSLVSGMRFEDLEEYYLRQGGRGVPPFIALIRGGESFSAVFSKDVTLGNELITAEYFELDGVRYCVCTSILQSYIFSSAKIGERASMLRILVYSVCALLICSVGYLSLSSRRKSIKIRMLQDELIGKNLFIQSELGSTRGRPADTSTSIKDPGTGFYSPDFYEALLLKMTLKRVSPVGVIIVRITNLREKIAGTGIPSVEELILKTAAVIQTHASDADVCARLSATEFAIIKLRSTEKLTIRAANTLFRDLSESETAFSYSAGFAFRDGEAPAEQAVEAAVSSVRPLPERTKQ